MGQRAQFPSGSWHSNSTRLLTSLETKHSSRVKKARERMEAWESSSGDHMWINQTRCTSKSYGAHVPVRTWETGGGGEAVRYQLFPVLVMFSVWHQSSGSASFNDNLLIRKFSLHIAPLVSISEQGIASPSEWELLEMNQAAWTSELWLARSACLRKVDAKSFFPGLCSSFEFSSCKFSYELKNPTNPFIVFRNLEIATGKQSSLSCPTSLGWIWCKMTPAALQYP